ncbi:hypothetical protein KY308_01750, partial [Candidatus Woesearchaeota archaeon]|nr:hypothetical protein [Candidatus Woesearchaeota archaeon]
MKIAHPSNKPDNFHYFGFMVHSTTNNISKRLRANDIRSRLIEAPYTDEEVNVKIIGVPKGGTPK